MGKISRKRRVLHVINVDCKFQSSRPSITPENRNYMFDFTFYKHIPFNFNLRNTNSIEVANAIITTALSDIIQIYFLVVVIPRIFHCTWIESGPSISVSKKCEKIHPHVWKLQAMQIFKAAYNMTINSAHTTGYENNCRGSARKYSTLGQLKSTKKFDL